MKIVVGTGHRKGLVQGTRSTVDIDLPAGEYPRMAKSHDYHAHLRWTGNLGAGTAQYTGYGRDYTVAIAGKPDLTGSADPMFRGSPELHNPEDLFLLSVSSCHMLTYLALCAKHKITVVDY